MLNDELSSLGWLVLSGYEVLIVALTDDGEPGHSGEQLC